MSLRVREKYWFTLKPRATSSPQKTTSNPLSNQTRLQHTNHQSSDLEPFKKHTPFGKSHTKSIDLDHLKSIQHSLGQFRVNKILELLERKFFWSPMRNDVQRHYPRCISCLKTKIKAMSHELYTPSPFANVPWEDISLDFILELPRTTKGFESNFMVMGKLFFGEVIRLYGLSPSIVLDKEPKCENHF